MTLAFRLYGAFNWPPTAVAVAGTTTRGVVELHYDKKDTPSAADAPLIPFLRWRPKHVADPDDPPTPNGHLLDLKPKEASDWFEDNTDKHCAIWLDATTAATGPANQTWIVFRGAFLFEQYRDDKLDLQWPLVTQCQYEDKKTVYSALGIARRSSEPLLYLNVHLPLPVRRTSLGKAGVDTRAFPFSVAFALAPKSKDFTTFSRLFAGWNEKDELPNLSATTKSFPVLDENLPSCKVLGKFGFAEIGTPPGGDFALYNLPDIATTEHYWPKNRQALLQDILWPYGFAVDYRNIDLLWATNLGRHDSSLRFVPLREGSRRSGIIYRASVQRGPAAPGGTGELKVDGTGLRLLLADEIGGHRADGTHFGANDTGIDVEEEATVDGWLRIGATLSADCELTWEIADADIWAENEDRSSAWSPRVTLRLHWVESVAPADIAAAAAEHGKDFEAGLLAQANFSFGATLNSLDAGEAGQPHSFLPELSKSASENVRFALYGSPLPASFDNKSNNIVVWGRPAPTKAVAQPPWRRPPMRLSLAKSDDLIDADERNRALMKLRLDASRMTFFQTREVKLALTLSHDAKWPPQSVESIEDGDPFFASFTLEALPTKTWSGRLSSLQFIGAKETEAKRAGHLRAGGRGTRLGLGNGAPILTYPDGRIAAEIRLAISAARVEPIGVDVARVDRTGRPAPLLIPLDRAAPRNKTVDVKANFFSLTTTETLSPTQDRRLEATISEDSQQTGNRSYVVLSSEPFTIYRFTQRALTDRGREDDASIAIYSGDDRIWQYKRVSDFYHYVLPPQSIGESADKPRRLEIHDWPDRKPDDPALSDRSTESPPRPFVLHVEKDKDGKDQLAPLSDLQRRALEYRLTPSAEMWIRPSDVERGYFMSESASYEIFRQRGEYGLGAALAFLRAEFLYGLPVGVDVSRERSIARGARVAEIEALIGRLPGPAREATADAGIANRWNALRAAVARRPERLEIWARDLDSTIDFTPARFSDGVTFALRYTALHRAPLIDQATPDDGVVPESADDYKSAPKIAGLDPSPLLTEMMSYPRNHPQGLSGGALWPVESLNLFRSMLRAPQSTGGTIESIALSPTGGDAAQKAQFLNGKVTIISETRNGYVERQQVEVLGRICAFWHRAKHVVVYERTVNPSAQFAPKKKDDPESTRSRRPILRKVREYIELLQPDRNYPDFTTASQRSTGFLERVRFNSRIINVDSAWSSEVGNFGWEIPLWNRLAARERPQVYPMPDVAFVSVAEGDGEKPLVAQECLDPDYLFFFADVSPNTRADTDTWQPLLNLDFPNMPVAQAIAAKVDAKSSADPGDLGQSEKRRRAVGRILPGLRRFTWRLAPAARKVAVNAGRARKPLYVGLESVSFMRATHTRDKELTPQLKDILDKVAAFPELSEAEVKLAQLPYWTQDGNGTPVADVDKFVARRDAIFAAINAKNVGQLKTELGNLKSFLNLGDASHKFSKKIADSILPPGVDFSSFKHISSGLKQGPAYCATLKTDAICMIQRKEMLVCTALQDWVGQTDELLRAVQPYLDGTTNKNTIIDALKESAIGYIKPIFEEASKDIGKIEEGIEKSRAALIDLEAEIELVIERARQRVQQFANGYDRTKPWSPERRKALRNGLKACVSSVRGDIVVAIEEARQRLGVELNDVSQAIGGHITKKLMDLAGLEAEALKQITTIRPVVDRFFMKIDQTLEQLLRGAAGAPGKLDELNTKIQASTASTGLKTRAETVLKAAKTACMDAQDKVADARAKATAIDAWADGATEQAADVVKTFVDSANAIRKAVAPSAKDLIEVANALVGEGVADLDKEINGVVVDINEKVDEISTWAEQWLTRIGHLVDAMTAPTIASLDSLLTQIKGKLHEVPATVLPIIGDVKQALQEVRKELAPDTLLKSVVGAQIIRPALVKIFDPLPDKIDPNMPDQIKAAISRIRAELDNFVQDVGALMRNLSDGALGELDQITTTCSALFEGAAGVEEYLNGLAGGAEAYIDAKLTQLLEALDKKVGPVTSLAGDVSDLIAAVNAFDYSVRSLQNNMARAHETARAYANRVFDQFGKIGDGGVLAAPSNILKLYSAVTSAPEIAALKADIDRIRAGFDEFSDIIDTTKANALFNRLGDELKALGLSLPFDKISDRLLPADLSNIDIAKLFRNFGGAKFASMLNGYKVPAGVKDAIRVTHDFDQKQARAWVQVDINAPMAGRRSLFSVGNFKADFVDMQLTGKVRLEASKDQDNVTETGYGRIGTAIDLVVAGQSLVRFEKFGLNYTREKGLDVEFDPKNIRLNPSFKFIQDFLSTLFPDDVGGLEIVKQNGIPVGVQHDFAIPPLSLNFATSGVSNISIENHFKLLAFPDFMLANRFNLSTVERPFIFSIFIIGGTGYIQIDAEYRPFDSELMVSVEAGAGGSASLAFAFGPFSGQVFITLSGALTYRKVIGKPGGGLSISVVLVIAGHVDVCGILTIGIVLMLRMTYRDSGQVDGEGSLSVTIRISKFFKISARADVKYKLRGGKSETTVTSSASMEPSPGLQQKVDAVKDAAKKLERARS